MSSVVFALLSVRTAIYCRSHAKKIIAAYEISCGLVRVVIFTFVGVSFMLKNVSTHLGVGTSVCNELDGETNTADLLKPERWPLLTPLSNFLDFDANYGLADKLTWRVCYGCQS